MSSKILLTIDDCFTDSSAKMLDFFKEKNIGAILFCIGERMQQFESSNIVSKTIKDGFIIGNHSYTHPIFAQRTPMQQRQEVLKTEEIIQQAYRNLEIPRPRKLFRFPFGMSAFYTKNLIRHYGFKSPWSGLQKHWDWHAELLDGHSVSSEEMDVNIDKCVKKARAYKRTSAIVLGHDCPANIDNGIFEKFYQKSIENGMSFMNSRDVEVFVRSLP